MTNLRLTGIPVRMYISATTQRDKKRQTVENEFMRWMKYFTNLDKHRKHGVAN